MSQPKLKIHVEHILHLTLICSRTASTPGVHKLVLRELLNPRQWKPPEDRKFTLDAEQINELCETAERILREEPSVLRLTGALPEQREHRLNVEWRCSEAASRLSASVHGQVKFNAAPQVACQACHIDVSTMRTRR